MTFLDALWHFGPIISPITKKNIQVMGCCRILRSQSPCIRLEDEAKSDNGPMIFPVLRMVGHIAEG